MNIIVELLNTTAQEIDDKTVEIGLYSNFDIDDVITFTDDALETILGVPRVFLPLVLKGCVAWAKENNVEVITAEHMKIIQDKRSKEKDKKKLSKEDKIALIAELEEEMRLYAKELNFEMAAQVRDAIIELRSGK